MFIGGLDSSVDRDTLLKLFGMVPNLLSLEMDMDSNGQFKVLLETLCLF